MHFHIMFAPNYITELRFASCRKEPTLNRKGRPELPQSNLTENITQFLFIMLIQGFYMKVADFVYFQKLG